MSRDRQELRQNRPQAELSGESACPTFAGKQLAAGGAGASACEPHFFTASQGADARSLRNLWRWAALAAGLALLWWGTPPDLPLCGFRWLTGRPCPFCGLTHAVFALAKGRWAEALHWHALSPLAVVMLAGLLWNPPRLARLWMPCAALFGAYGVWRIVLGTGHF